MKKVSTLSQQGFSLVELMVVVAIIGILAAMSVGQVQKQIAKSRQSEAKTDLSQMYLAEKSFNAEWSSYCTDFLSIGLSFEGNMRYSIGFGGNDIPVSTITGYTGAAGSLVYKSVLGACVGTCTVIESNGVAPATPAPAVVTTATTFLGQANAAIYNTTQDSWDINEGKIITNTVAGIP